MTARTLRLLAAAVCLCTLAACASSRPASRFAPASPDTAREALDAWASVRERAASLPASRLLYDAKLFSGGAPGVPGTLAVTYDGKAVVTASLTGPFGSRIAEYRNGELTGQDKRAFVVDPEALRAVLAGAWNGQTPSVEGVDGGRCLISFDAGESRVVAVLDVAARSLVSAEVTSRAGHLVVDYDGEPRPWPGRLTVKDEAADKSLALKLVAVEPVAPPGGAGG